MPIVDGNLLDSKRLRLINGITSGVMGILFLLAFINFLIKGNSLTLLMLSNAIVGVAFLFNSFCNLFGKVSPISGLVFVMVLGLGVMIMAWSSSNILGIPEIYAHLASIIFGLFLTSFLLLGGYSLYKKHVKTQYS